MRCILLAVGPTRLLLGQVLDRPFLQHVVEQLIARGVRSMRTLLPQGDRELSGLLGDGSRWGIDIEYTRIAGEPGWQDISSIPEANQRELILVGRADCLPFFPSFCSEEGADVAPTIYFEEEGLRSRWSGWVLLPGIDFAAFARGLSAGNDWREILRQEGVRARKVFLARQGLSCTSEKELLRSNRAALDGSFPNLFFNGRQVQPGVWMARAAKIPDSVTIHAPCYIGEESWIEADCTLGPHAVIGPNCLVSRGTVITRSILTESTFLGPGLEVADSLVNRTRVHNVRLGAEIEIEERHVACDLSDKSSRPWWPF